MNRFTPAAVIAVGILFLLNTSTVAQFATGTPMNPESGWTDTFSQIGVTNLTMNAIAYGPDGSLYLAGNPNMGGVFQRQPAIYKFDGKSWTSLDHGFDSAIESIAVDAAGILYAGGGFNVIGDLEVNGIAMFDGNWHAMGDGLKTDSEHRVESIAIHQNGTVYAGGRFGWYDHDVERWVNNGISRYLDGEWRSLEGGLIRSLPTPNFQPIGTIGRVNAMAFDSNDMLWVAGLFNYAGSVEVQDLAIWVSDTNEESSTDFWVAPAPFRSDGELIHNRQHGVTGLTTGPDNVIYVTGKDIILNDFEEPLIMKYENGTWITIENDFGFLFQAPGIAVDAEGNVFLSTEANPDGYSTYQIYRLDGGSFTKIASGTGSTITNSPKSGADRSIHMLTIDPDDHLVVAGGFRTIGPNDGDVSRIRADNIARWDGESWHPYGNSPLGHLNGQRRSTGMIINDIALSPEGFITFAGEDISYLNGVPSRGLIHWDPDNATWVKSEPYPDFLPPHFNINTILYDHDGRLIIGGSLGSYEDNQGEPLRHVAIIDGDGWQSLGDGLTRIGGDITQSYVRDLLQAPDRTIYGAGSFSGSGDVPLRNIAQWDGENWLPLGDGLSAEAAHMTLDHNGDLIVGGRFRRADGTNRTGFIVNFVARWDGEEWHAMGSGLPGNNTVTALTTGPDGTVYVSNTNNVFRWDRESSWEIMGEEFGLFIQTLTTDADGSVYVGGSFTTYGDQPLERIARWNGETWEQLGSGVGPQGVYSFLIHDETLYVGGRYQEAGGRFTNSIDTWHIGPVTPVSINENDHEFVAARILLAESYPNPFNPSTNIRFNVPEQSRTVLDVFDVTGRRVARLLDTNLTSGQHQATWNASNYASGVYIYRITSGSQVFTGKMILLK